MDVVGNLKSKKKIKSLNKRTSEKQVNKQFENNKFNVKHHFLCVFILSYALRKIIYNICMYYTIFYRGGIT